MTNGQITPEIEAEYRRLRRSGLSEEEAKRRLGIPTGPARPQAQRAPETPQEPTEDTRGAVQEFGRGFGLGASQAATSLGAGIGWLGRKGAELVPGEGPVERAFSSLERRSEAAGDELERIFDPRGGAGKAGQVLGRIGGEIGTTVMTGGLGKAGLLKFAPRVAQSARALTGGSRVAQAAALAAPDVALSLPRAASRAREDGNLPLELALELGGSAAGGALGSFLDARRARAAVAAAEETVPDGASAAARAAAAEMAEEAAPEATSAVPALTGTRAPKVQVSEGIRNVPMNKGVFREDGVLPAILDWAGSVSGAVKKAPRTVFDRYRTITDLFEPGPAREQMQGLLSQLDASTQEAVGNAWDIYAPWIRENADNLDEISRAALIRADYANRFPSQGAARPGVEKLFGYSDETIRELNDEILANPYLAEKTDELMGLFRDILSQREAAGLLGEAQAQAVRESADYYTPLLRAFTEEVRRGALKGGRGMIAGKGVRSMDRMLSRTGPIQDPLEVLLGEQIRLQRDLAKNRVMQRIRSIIPPGGIPGVIRKMRMIKNPETGELAFERAREGEQVFEAIDNGRKVAYGVSDPDLYQVLAVGDYQFSDPISRATQWFGNLKRESIVLPPDFSLLSLARDLPFYAIQGAGPAIGREGIAGAGGGALLGAATAEEGERLEGAAIGAGLGLSAGSLARPFAQLLTALKSVAAKDEQWRQFVREGGSTAGLAVTDPRDMRKLINQMKKPQDILTPRNPLDALRWIGAVAENAPRLAKWQEQEALRRAQGIREGLSGRALEEFVEEAAPLRAWQAQDVTLPFARKGSSKALQWFRGNTPFLGAMLNSWNKLARMVTGPDRGKLATRAGAIVTAPSIALWFINKDNPEYWDRPLWERNMFWLVPKSLVPGSGEKKGFYRVPKAHELGLIFGSIPERILDAAARAGTIESAAPAGAEIDSEVGETLFTFTKQSVAGAMPIPALAQPFLESAVNRDLFRNRQIIPTYLRDRPRELQYRETTSGLGRLLGEATADLPLGVSPIRFDQAVESLLGTGGRRALSLADAVLASQGVQTPVERMTPGEIAAELTGAARFMAKDYDVGQIEYNISSIIDRGAAAYSGLRDKIEQGAPQEEIDEFENRHRRDIDAYAALTGVNRALNKIREARNVIVRDRTIPGEEKRQMMEELRDAGLEISREAFEILQSVRQENDRR